MRAVEELVAGASVDMIASSPSQGMTETDVTIFQELYLSHFGLKLERSEARSKLSLLVRQMQIVYRPIKRTAIFLDATGEGE